MLGLLSEVSDLDLVRRLQNLTLEVEIRPHAYVTRVRFVVRSQLLTTLGLKPPTCTAFNHS